MRAHAYRLTPGTDLRAELERLTPAHALRAGRIGGHRAKGCIVNTTAELVIGGLAQVEFRRARDPATGYKELDVAPRPQA
jgi:hypothetical protein